MPPQRLVHKRKEEEETEQQQQQDADDDKGSTSKLFISGHIEKQVKEISSVSKKLQGFAASAPIPLAARIKKNVAKQQAPIANDIGKQLLPTKKRHRSEFDLFNEYTSSASQIKQTTVEQDEEQFQEILTETREIEQVVTDRRMFTAGASDPETFILPNFTRLEDQLLLKVLRRPWLQLQKEMAKKKRGKEEEEEDEEEEEENFKRKTRHCEYTIKDGSFFWPGIYRKVRKLDAFSFKNMTAESLSSRWEVISKPGFFQERSGVSIPDGTRVYWGSGNVSEGRDKFDTYRFATRLQMTAPFESNDGTPVILAEPVEDVVIKTPETIAQIELLIDDETHELTFSKKGLEDEPESLDNKLYYVVKTLFFSKTGKDFEGRVVYNPKKQQVSQLELLSPFDNRRVFHQHATFENLLPALWSRIFRDTPMILSIE
jgi:hypothetical protein